MEDCAGEDCAQTVLSDNDATDRAAAITAIEKSFFTIESRKLEVRSSRTKEFTSSVAAGAPSRDGSVPVHHKNMKVHEQSRNSEPSCTLFDCRANLLRTLLARSRTLTKLAVQRVRIEA